jgi:general secretion pathway protein D
VDGPAQTKPFSQKSVPPDANFNTRRQFRARHRYLAHPRGLLIGALLAALSGGALSIGAAEPSASELFKRGRRFEKKGDLAQAYLLYSQAAAVDPSHRQYWLRAEALRTKASIQANVMPALQAAAPPAAAEPKAPLPETSPKEREEARRPQPPVELAAAPGNQSFDLRADAKALWEQVTKVYGLDVIFDGDYQPGTVGRLRLSDVGYREALHALMAATSSFIVPIGPRLILVVKDTEAKRREVENTIALTVPIPESITVQDAQDMARSVQQLMEIQRFAIDSAQRLVFMRDRASKVVPAQALLNDLLRKRPQIMIEAELIQVPKKSTLQYGLGLPTAFPIVPLVKTLALSGSALSFGLGIGSAQLVANWSKSVGKTLLRAELRGLDSMPASFHAGEKYPIITMSYMGEISSDQQGFLPPPAFNFEDLGLVLKVTPKVHDREEVTLEIDAEYRLLGNATLNGNPVISSRKFVNHVRLRFDQSAIIAGLVSNASSTTLSGPAGLSSLPVIGTVLGRTIRERDETETLLVLKPRLLTLPPTEFVTRGIWIGSESRLLPPI